MHFSNTEYKSNINILNLIDLIFRFVLTSLVRLNVWAMIYAPNILKIVQLININ